MQEFDLALIKRRSIQGVLALSSRTFVIQIISFLSNIALTILLSPAIFGIYFVVTAFIAFLSYFSDIGLAAALIQKKEPLTLEDLRTTFTIQQILVLAVALIFLSLSGFVSSFYHLQKDGVLLYQVLIISFLLSSLKTIPSIILERDLNFKKLVVPQIVETLFFNLTAVILAFKGFGISSFTYAVLLRGLSGVLAIYIISPWPIGFSFSKKVAKNLLSFGIPFQANSILALIKDDLLTIYLGKVLPIAQVGYIGFAQKWAMTPLRLVMDNIIRVTFPSFSRLQDEKEHLSRALEKSLFASLLLVYPSIIGLVILAPYFIHLVPRYDKWQPALISLYFFSANAFLSALSTPLINALNAIGKIRISLYLMIFWTVSTWVLTPVAIIIWGFNAVSGVSAFIALSVVGIVYITKRYVHFSLKNSVFTPFASSLLMGLIVYFSARFIIKDFLSLVFIICLGIIVYFVTIFILARRQLLADIQTIKDSFIK
jgi:O-antigen/teichoic acid export membrane protein